MNIFDWIAERLIPSSLSDEKEVWDGKNYTKKCN